MSGLIELDIGLNGSSRSKFQMKNISAIIIIFLLTKATAWGEDYKFGWKVTADGWAVQDDRCADPNNHNVTCQYLFAGTAFSSENLLHGTSPDEVRQKNRGVDQFIENGIAKNNIALIFSAPEFK